MGEPVHELLDLLHAVGLQKIAEGGHLIAVHRKFFRAGEKNTGAVVTKGTQPAVCLHSGIMAKALGVKPDAAAGHSLGEFSALVGAGALSCEDGLKLV